MEEKEYYRITRENGYSSYYNSLLWLEFYLKSSFGGLHYLEIAESEKREISGELKEIIKLAYAHCGHLGKDLYKVELIKR